MLSNDAFARPPASLEDRMATLEETVSALFAAVTALGERVAEATQAEEIIRRARAGQRPPE